jgi:hypothetical protein
MNESPIYSSTALILSVTVITVLTVLTVDH